MSGSPQLQLQPQRDWAKDARNKRKALSGAALVDKLIKDLRDTRQRNNRNKLISLQLTAVSVSYLLQQFTAHIPYKIGVDPSSERLIDIAGINPSSPPSTAATSAADEEFDLTVSNLGVSNSSLNFFGRRTRSSTSAATSSELTSSVPVSYKEEAAHGLIEEEVDPLEFVSALLTLHELLKSVQHFRLTGKYWPVRENHDTPSSASDPSTPVPPSVLDPIVDLSLFPNVSILEVEAVPPEAIINLAAVFPKLRLLKFEKAGIFSIPNLFPSSASLPLLTHLKCSQCALDELCGLASNPPPLKSLTNLQSLNLSRNNLLHHTTALAGMSSLVNLQKVDLSYNFLSTMEGANRMLGNIKVLLLTGNRLTNGKGLEKLYSIEYLAIDDNNIHALADIAGITKLPCLSDLNLKDNPFCDSNFRIPVLNLFRSHRGGVTETIPNSNLHSLLLPTLDRVPANKKELLALKELTFAPVVAVPEPSVDGSVNASVSVSTLLTDDTGVWRHTAESSSSVNNDVAEANVMGGGKKKKKNRKKAQIEDGEMAISATFEVAKESASKGTFSSFSTGSMGVILNESGLESSVTSPSSDAGREEDDVGVAAANRREARKKRRSRMADKMSALRTTITALEDVEEDAEGRNVDPSQTDTPPKIDPPPQPDAPPQPPSSPSSAAPSSPAPTDLIVVKAGELTLETTGAGENGGADSAPTVSTNVSYEPKRIKKKKKKKKILRPDVTEVQGIDDPFNYLNELGMEHPTPTPTVAPNSPPKPPTPSLPSPNNQPETPEQPPPQPDGKSSLKPTPKVKVRNDDSMSQNSTDFLEEFWSAGVEGASIASVEKERRRGSSNAILFTGGENDEEEEASVSDLNVYYGNPHHKNLIIKDNLTLYFREQVFNDITATPWMEALDGEKWSELEKEKVIEVYVEDIVGVGGKGVPANLMVQRGFHGDVVGTYDAGVKCCVVVTSGSIYFVAYDDAMDGRFVNNDKTMTKPKCYKRHGLESLTWCRIGFFFQRLLLTFEDSTSKTFSYNILTTSKVACYSILKVLTPVANEVKSEDATGNGKKVKIDNDDRFVLDTFHKMCTDPARSGEGASGTVIHYGISLQQWKSGGRDPVRRAVFVTDVDIFLVDEYYYGDGADSGGFTTFEPGTVEEGSVAFRLVDQNDLGSITEVRPADENPKMITICFKQKSVVK
eukprot:CAMPEP_0118642780 /NCGR_PEP_ID=MMETSP0785-20121206/6017_1 /TAXON_ID=91992 /ORGANISM="Bolidomonas pacifica, Strain CCMP 1866" /LENGTH=1183 /DNA_ID=CAMNT_0006534353 /DNA_START=107 /DNA_END=3655 /DNA_ORIENTATION=-